MPSEKGNLLGQSTLLIDRYDSKCASSTGFPIDRKIFRVGLDSTISYILFPPPPRYSHLHQIRIPSIATDMQVIVACFLPRGLSEDMSYSPSQLDLVPPAPGEAYDISTREQSGPPCGLDSIVCNVFFGLISIFGMLRATWVRGGEVVRSSRKLSYSMVDTETQLYAQVALRHSGRIWKSRFARQSGASLFQPLFRFNLLKPLYLALFATPVQKKPDSFDFDDAQRLLSVEYRTFLLGVLTILISRKNFKMHCQSYGLSQYSLLPSFTNVS